MGSIPSKMDQITLAGQVYALDIPCQVIYMDSAHKKFPQKQ